MNIDLTPIFQALIALLAAIITFRVVPWIKSKTTGAQQQNLAAAARIAVYAAEQIYGANNGDLKLDYALDILEDKGFRLDRGILREAVEAALKEAYFSGLHGERPEAVGAEETEDGSI